MKLLLLTLALLGVYAGDLSAETLTAICRDPVGWGVGYETGKAVFESDGFTEAVFTYSWQTDKDEATIISQSSKGAGGTPLTEKAAVIKLDGSVTFMVLYRSTIWVHTLFIGPKVMIMSRHLDGRGPTTGSAAGSLFHARCVVAIQ
ncbi:MAG: hypothetical protein EXR27_17070 [Betaproteobacteria bacterium]|nr:hypothetical protein [Betaproteobacteria bacterium]